MQSQKYQKQLAGFDCKRLSKRFVSLKLLEQEESLIHTLSEYLGENPLNDPLIASTVDACREKLEQNNISLERLTDIIVSCIVLRAEEVCSDAITFEKCNYNARDRKIDKWLTGKWTGFPIMLLLLAVVFWITITGANYPSQLLSGGLFWVEDRLTDFCHYIGMPAWLHGALVLGIYRVLAWVVSVMLPPMAIFFPLFTLLEDLGYLPRIAFNLDKYFKKANACGKQALDHVHGIRLQCAGVVGCRIIDFSQRTVDCYYYKQFRSLQRQISHLDCNYYDVLYFWGHCLKSFRQPACGTAIGSFHPDSDRSDRIGNSNDVLDLTLAVQNHPERYSILLYAGVAALSAAPKSGKSSAFRL